MPSISTNLVIAGFLLQTLILIFFCLSLYRALLVVKDYNRTMPPGAVWLLLVPFFALFWNFKVITSMASSLYREFNERDFDIEKQPGLVPGMIYAVSSVVYPLIVVAMPTFLVVAAIISLLELVYFIKYWMKINWYRKVLENDAAGSEAE